jgi:hypothetical protein
MASLSIVAVPVSEKVQAETFNTLAEPFAFIGTGEPPLSCASAEPLTDKFPHVAEKSPASIVDVWVVTRHWRFPQVDALGSVDNDCDVHVPRYDADEVGAGPLVFPEGAVGLSASVLVC